MGRCSPSRFRALVRLGACRTRPRTRNATAPATPVRTIVESRSRVSIPHSLCVRDGTGTGTAERTPPCSFVLQPTPHYRKTWDPPHPALSCSSPAVSQASHQVVFIPTSSQSFPPLPTRSLGLKHDRGLILQTMLWRRGARYTHTAFSNASGHEEQPSLRVTPRVGTASIRVPPSYALCRHVTN